MARSKNSRTRKQWAARISACWKDGAGNMIDTIFGVAEELKAARAELERGEYMLMFEQKEVPLIYSKANMFMRIADSPKIQEFQHAGILPPDWSTLYLLTRLAKNVPELFDRLVEDGTIHSTMSRGEISKILRLQRVAEDEQRVLNLQPIIGKFRTLVLDPAWEYDWLSIAGRAKPGYAMQSIEELMTLNVRAWADEEVGTHLYLWTTNNFMAEACKLVAHWGFQHRTLITWIKPPPFGLGSYFRNSTEHCLFATLNETTTRPAAASISTHLQAERGEHSEKPEAFYEIVRASSYPPYGEGNQREPRPDFTNLFEEVVSEPEPVAAE